MHIIERAFDFSVMYMLVRIGIQGSKFDQKIEAVADWLGKKF